MFQEVFQDLNLLKKGTPAGKTHFTSLLGECPSKCARVARGQQPRRGQRLKANFENHSTHAVLHCISTPKKSTPHFRSYVLNNFFSDHQEGKLTNTIFWQVLCFNLKSRMQKQELPDAIMMLVKAAVLTAALAQILGPVMANKPGHAYFEQPCCGHSHLRHHKG